MKNKRTEKNKDRALAYGEVTGHAHRANVDVWETEDGTKELDGPATITHEEHKPVTIPKVVVESGITQEFDYNEYISRKVLD